MVGFQAMTGGRQGLPGSEAGTLAGLGGPQEAPCLWVLQPLPVDESLGGPGDNLGTGERWSQSPSWGEGGRLVRRGWLGTLGVAWWVGDPSRGRTWVPEGWGVGLHLGRVGLAECVRMGGPGGPPVTSRPPFLFMVLEGRCPVSLSLTPQSPSRIGVTPLESETGPGTCPYQGVLRRLDPSTMDE